MMNSAQWKQKKKKTSTPLKSRYIKIIKHSQSLRHEEDLYNDTAMLLCLLSSV